MDDIAVIILAAGKGTRMKSDLAKVLHKVADLPMVVHVVRAAQGVTQDNIHVVVGHQADQVKREVEQHCRVRFAHQAQLLGTGDAVKAALPQIKKEIRDVLVLCGDVPLIQKKTLQTFVASHRAGGAKLSVLAVTLDNPTGYGRIIRDAGGNFVAIREEADASEDEKKITIVNSGIYCFDRHFLETGVNLIGNTNEQAEYYLTDLAEIAVSQKVAIQVETTGNPVQVMGVNTCEQLVEAGALFHARDNELP